MGGGGGRVERRRAGCKGGSGQLRKAGEMGCRRTVSHGVAAGAAPVAPAWAALPSSTATVCMRTELHTHGCDNALCPSPLSLPTFRQLCQPAASCQGVVAARALFDDVPAAQADQAAGQSPQERGAQRCAQRPSCGCVHAQALQAGASSCDCRGSRHARRMCFSSAPGRLHCMPPTLRP